MYMQYMNIIGKIKKIFVQALETGRKVSILHVFFMPVLQWIQINCISSQQCIYIVFILQRHKVQNICQIVWKEQKLTLVFSITSTLILLLILTVLFTCIGYPKTIFWSITVYNKILSRKCNLTAYIEHVQNKMLLLNWVWFAQVSVYNSWKKKHL